MTDAAATDAAALVRKAAECRERLLGPRELPGAHAFPPRQLRVAVRVRPVLPTEEGLVGEPIPGRSAASFAQVDYEAVVADELHAQVHALSEQRHIGAPTGEIEVSTVRAHRVFGPAASDEAVFVAEGARLVECALGGGAGTLIAFGQTGAGKTRTSLAVMRQAAAALLGHGRLRISYCQLLGERCEDCLGCLAEGAEGERAPVASEGAPGSASVPSPESADTVGGASHGGASHGASRKPVELRVDADGGLVVAGLSERLVESEEEAEAVLARAHAARETAATAGNAASSRSHAVCTLRCACGGSIVVVDLAGSERWHDALAHGDERLREMRATNGDRRASPPPW